MNKLDRQYLDLVNDIISKGSSSGDRTGTGTIKVFGREIRHNMKDGLPMLTTKKMFAKGVIAELLWFLSGNTNIKTLVDDGVNIWVGDCYKKYRNYCSKMEEPETEYLFEDINENKLRAYTEKEFIQAIKDNYNGFANKFGDIGPGYGCQWRNFGGNGKDQISELIETLKNNPESRRLMVSAWDPNTLDQTTLPPCHYGFQLFTRELTFAERDNLTKDQYPRIDPVYFGTPFVTTNEMLDDCFDNVPKYEVSLKWNQRSVDTLLGLPFNIMSYGLLLEMIAQQANMVPGELIGSLGDTHIYKNQVEIYKSEQMEETGSDILPKLNLTKAKDIFSYKLMDFEIVGYNPGKNIKYPLSN